MSFALDSDVFEKKDANGNPRTISERTQKDYKGKLNSLAKLGWGDRSALKKNHKVIIDHIKSLYPDDTELARHKKRFILFAIFWSMDTPYIAKKNPYHTYLQKIPPIKNVSTGEDWVALKEYRELSLNISN